MEGISGYQLGEGRSEGEKKKGEGRSHDTYESFLKYILYNICCPRQTRKQQFIFQIAADFANKDESATEADWKSIVEIVTVHLSRKNEVELETELEKWMLIASKTLRNSFRKFEELGLQIFNQLEPTSEKQRAMITWLLTGVYYRIRQ